MPAVGRLWPSDVDDGDGDDDEDDQDLGSATVFPGLQF